MDPIAKDLAEKKYSLLEFKSLSVRVLNHMRNTLTNFETKPPYRIYSSTSGNTKKFIRPINLDLFYLNPEQFLIKFQELEVLLKLIRGNGKTYLNNYQKHLIDSVLYTTQQSLGIGMDLLLNANSARKHVGNRFEELIKSVFDEIGITNMRSVLKIPYETETGEKIYKCENDLILSPYSKVKSTNNSLDKNEIVVSIKTTSKDRMGKIFIDKLLLQKFIGHEQKVIGIFLNDVQRKEEDNISYTLVSGLFMVYTTFLAELQGIYYLDPPPNALKSPYNNHMTTFSHLVSEDIFDILSS